MVQRRHIIHPKSKIGLAAGLGFLLVAVLTLQVNALKAQGIGDEAAIRAAREQSNRAIARHDVDAVISFLDADFVIIVSTGAILHSRDEMSKEFTQHFAEFPDVVYVRAPTDITVSDVYPLAIENGTWVGTRTTPNGGLKNGGKYTAGWRKIEGVWKIHSELYVALHCDGTDC